MYQRKIYLYLVQSSFRLGGANGPFYTQTHHPHPHPTPRLHSTLKSIFWLWPSKNNIWYHLEQLISINQLSFFIMITQIKWQFKCSPFLHQQQRWKWEVTLKRIKCFIAPFLTFLLKILAKLLKILFFDITKLSQLISFYLSA